MCLWDVGRVAVVRVPLRMNEQFPNCSEMLVDLGFYGGDRSLERRSLARRKQKEEKKNLPLCSSFGSTAQPWGVGRDQLQLFALVG